MCENPQSIDDAMHTSIETARCGSCKIAAIHVSNNLYIEPYVLNSGIDGVYCIVRGIRPGIYQRSDIIAMSHRAIPVYSMCIALEMEMHRIVQLCRTKSYKNVTIASLVRVRNTTGAITSV